ncbi:BglG family transcription antiterminator [Bacillus pumilus]|uniref:BglG family transcription antiterminator n=1 Tax=Bacillus pumilus TaxID=1408 RepID=UPI002236F659|nr:BglG family transcription antiterminator [Bacillus pumilus]MCW4683053.1 BglG family transcription antiterminator [Bacillus pumilus]
MHLTKRGTTLLSMLLHTTSYLSIEDLQNRLNVSTRTVYSEIKRMNSWLKTHELSGVQRKDQLGYYLNPHEKEVIIQKADTILVGHDYEPCVKERRAILLLSIACSEKCLKIDDFMKLTKVSRNTLLEDMKQLKEALSKQQLTLHYQAACGYLISGKERAIRLALKPYIHSIRTMIKNEKVFPSFWLKGPISYKRLKHLLEQSEQELKLEFADDMLDQLSLDLFFYFKRMKLGRAVHLSNEEKRTLQETDECLAAIRFMARIQRETGLQVHDDEIYFLSTLWLSAKKQKLPSSQKPEEHLIRTIARQMIFDFQRYACISFQEYEALEQNLTMHLIPAYYRLIYHIDISNELTESIKKTQPEVFDITQKVVCHLEKATCSKISDHEIAYVAMHFGGWMRREGISPIVRRSVYIVCGEGIGTSHMLKTQLIELIGYIEVRDLLSKRSYEEMSSIDVDFVVSTTPITFKGKPVHLVHPILTAYEKKTLLQYGEGAETMFDEKNVNVLFKIIQQHTIVQNEKALLRDLKELLHPAYVSHQKGWKPVLNDLLTEKTIQLQQTAETWQEAITKAAQPLLDQNAIQKGYVEAMIQSVDQNGPYIVIAPQVAIPHARPEDGVNELSMSLMSFERPVFFSKDEKKQVRLIIVLAAIDSMTHLKALKQLTMLLSDEKRREQLVEANELASVQKLIDQFSQR